MYDGNSLPRVSDFDKASFFIKAFQKVFVKYNEKK